MKKNKMIEKLSKGWRWKEEPKNHTKRHFGRMIFGFTMVLLLISGYQLFMISWEKFDMKKSYLWNTISSATFVNDRGNFSSSASTIDQYDQTRKETTTTTTRIYERKSSVRNAKSFIGSSNHPFLIDIPQVEVKQFDLLGSLLAITITTTHEVEEGQVISDDVFDEEATTKGMLNHTQKKKKTVLVTGATGFIGMHLSLRLVQDPNLNYNVIAFDRDLHISPDNNKDNDSMKQHRQQDAATTIHSYVKHQRTQIMKRVSKSKKLTLVNGNVCDRHLLNQTIFDFKVDTIVHLATTDEEVSHTVTRPFSYPLNNQDCFIDVLEVIKHLDPQQKQKTKLLYASSKKSFGTSYVLPGEDCTAGSSDEVISPALLLQDNKQISFFDEKENALPTFPTMSELKHFSKTSHNGKTYRSPTIHPTSPRLTRRTNEMIARAYWSLYNVSSIGIRFTQLYGPYGRTDMNLFKKTAYQHQAALVQKEEERRQPRSKKLNDEIEHDTKLNSEISRNDITQPTVFPLQSLMYIDDAIDDLVRLIENNEHQNVNVEDMEEKKEKNALKKNEALVAVIDTGCQVSDHDVSNALDNAFNSHNKVTKSSHDGSSLTTNDNNDYCRSDVYRLEEGMILFLAWFKSIPKSVLLSTTSSNIPTPSSPSTTAGPTTNEKSIALLRKPVTDLCFVTSMFSTDVSQTDFIKDISDYNHTKMDPTLPFKFYFFTNLNDMACPGWERVVMPDLPYRRMITQSRWPKFMAWMHPKLQTCKTILYSDAKIPFYDLTQYQWEILTRIAHRSVSGLVQRRSFHVDKHKTTILQELDRVLQRQKDIKPNVEASKKWLKEQPNFNATLVTPGYYNMFLVYNPWNENWRELSTTFWAHYSNEELSWRDQWLWRYLTYYTLAVTPTTFKRHEMGGGLYKLGLWYNDTYSEVHSRTHHYTAEADSNALTQI